MGTEPFYDMQAVGWKLHYKSVFILTRDELCEAVWENHKERVKMVA